MPRQRTSLKLERFLTPDALQILEPRIDEAPGRVRCAQFFEWLAKETDQLIDLVHVKKISQTDVDRFFQARRYDKPEQQTKIIQDLRSIAKRLQNVSGVIVPGFSVLKAPRRVAKPRETLSVKDAEILIAWPPEPGLPTAKRHTAMFAIMYILGAQAGEVARARRSDYVKEPEATIHLPNRRGGRTLPLVPLLVELIEEHLSEFPALPADGPLFPNLRGKWQSNLAPLNLELARRTGVLGIGFRVRPLDLREACKAHMRERGIPRLTLQALLGVSTPDKTHLFGRQPRLKATS